MIDFKGFVLKNEQSKYGENNQGNNFLDNL